jgi:MATE family multidrug resistance protein
MLVMMIFVLRSKHFKSYLEKFNILFIDLNRIKSILKIGAPVAFQYVFEISSFAGASLLAGKIGAVEQASHNVALTLAAMTYMGASGIASASTIKVGTAYGKGNIIRLNKFANVSYHLVILFMIITATTFAICNDYLPYIITQDQKVIAIASQLLIIAGLFQLFDGTQVVGLGVLRGIGDVNIPTILTFCAYWIVGIPSGYIMGIELNLGIQGIWYGLTLGLLTSSILLYLRYKYVIKQKMRLKIL